MRADIRDEEKRRNSLGRADEDKERKSAIYLHKSPSHLDCSQRRRRAAWITHFSTSLQRRQTGGKRIRDDGGEGKFSVSERRQPLLPWHLASWLRILCTILKGNTNTSDSDCRANTIKCWWLSRLNRKVDSGLKHFFSKSHFSTRTLQKQKENKHLLLKTPHHVFRDDLHSQCGAHSDTQDNQVNLVLTRPVTHSRWCSTCSSGVCYTHVELRGQISSNI